MMSAKKPARKAKNTTDFENENRSEQ
jgi:hypothetical protein